MSLSLLLLSPISFCSGDSSARDAVFRVPLFYAEFSPFGRPIHDIFLKEITFLAYAAGPSVAHDELCLFLSSVSPMALSPSVQVIPKLDAVFRVPLFYAEFSPFGCLRPPVHDIFLL